MRLRKAYEGQAALKLSWLPLRRHCCHFFSPSQFDHSRTEITKTAKIHKKGRTSLILKHHTWFTIDDGEDWTVTIECEPEKFWLVAWYPLDPCTPLLDRGRRLVNFWQKLILVNMIKRNGLDYRFLSDIQTNRHADSREGCSIIINTNFLHALICGKNALLSESENVMEKTRLIARRT